MNTDHVFTNEIQTSSISAQSVDIDELIIDNLVATVATMNTLTTNVDFGANVLSAANLTTNLLTTTTYTIGELFAGQISASQQIQTDTYTVQSPSPTTTLTTKQKILIAIGVVAAVVAIAVIVIATSGTALFAVPALVAGAIPVEGAVGVAAAGAAIQMSAVTTAALTAGAVVYGGVAVGTLVAAAISPASYAPNLRAVALDATFGKAFLSDMLFGTTSNTSVSTPYTEYLLIQNEVHGSYALPRIIGYNPQLGFFDDGAYYGSQKAYLSLCTDAPYNTLRFNEDGNLAIYDSTSDPPTWESNTQVSSLKYKSNIKPIVGAKNTLAQIDCIYYNENDVGVKAQQLEQLFRQATFGEGRRVRLEKLIPLLVEGMKELYYMQEIYLNK